jgi:hypothetical protein
MPGYAIEPQKSDSLLVVEPETFEELYGKVFYGMTFDPESGSATVEVIREGEIVSLPEQTNWIPEEYIHWFASPKSINFTWEGTKGTHLLMEVV